MLPLTVPGTHPLLHCTSGLPGEEMFASQVLHSET